MALFRPVHCPRGGWLLLATVLGLCCTASDCQRNTWVRPAPMCMRRPLLSADQAVKQAAIWRGRPHDRLGVRT
jgi:hypothetical protein